MGYRLRQYHQKGYGTGTGSGAPTYCAEATAFFAEHSVQLSNPNKLVVNHCFEYLIANNAFSNVSVLWFPILLTEQQSLTNWKTPTSFRPTAYNFGSTFVPKVGFPANAAALTYMATGWIPATHGGSNYQLLNAKVGAFMKDNVADDGLCMGVRNNGTISLRPRATFDQATGVINGSGGSVANTNGQGLFTIGSSNGTTNQINRNGSLLGNTTDTFNAQLSDGQLFLYAWNDGAIAPNAPALHINNNTMQAAFAASPSINEAAIIYVRDYLIANLV